MNDVITILVCIAGATYLSTLKGDHAAGITVLMGITAQAYSHYSAVKKLSDKVDELQVKQ